MNMKSNQQNIISFLLLLALALLASSENAYSQNHPDGGFAVDIIVGCAPFTITLTDTSKYATDRKRRYNYDFNTALEADDEANNNFELEKLTHTYTEAGVYSIAQLANVGSDIGALFVSANIIRVYDPIPPQFQLSTCEGNKINISITDTIYNELLVDWGDGNTSVLDSGANESHFYATSGVKNMQVFGDFANGGGTCGNRMEEIQLFENLPRATITSANSDQDNTIKILFSANEQISYELQEKASGGDFQTIQILDKGNSEVALTGKNAGDGLCYRIIATDLCNDTQTNSNEICFLKNPTVLAEENGNQLNWESYSGSGFDEYQLLRDDALISNYFQSTINSHLDANVSCNENYCYSIRTQLSGRTSIEQAISCVTSIASGEPTRAVNFLATVENQQLQLNWALTSSATPKEFWLIKTAGGVTDSVQISGTTYSDSELDVSDQQACYQIRITDDCDNVGQSIQACNILLQGEKQGLDNFLNWQIPTYLEDYELFLEILNEDLSVKESVEIVSNTNTYLQLLNELEGQIARYRIRGFSVAKNQTVFSNLLQISENLEVLIPDIFSPNRDGLNDVFTILGNYISTAEILIFSRLGNKIFESSDINIGWDGNFQGKNAPQGTYTYVIQGVDNFGNTFSRKGTLVLVR
jgi:gliding motility-associated-like protein